MEKLSGYKTLIVNVLTIAAAALGAFPADWSVEYVTMALAGINVALRFLTTGPVAMLR